MPYDETSSGNGHALGVMFATVLSNEDDENKGCVKVQLLCEGAQAGILEGVKVMTPYAGESHGMYLLPEVGDQVVVAFLEGSMDRPVVMGSLYSRKDSMLAGSYQEKNTSKRFQTKSGTLVELSDETDSEAVTVKTPKGLTLELKDADEKISLIAGSSSLVVDGKSGKISILGEKEIELKCGSASITLKSGGAITVQGNQVEAKGSAVKLDSSGTLDLKGQKSGMTGSVVEVNSQGILTLKGSITKIN